MSIWATVEMGKEILAHQISISAEALEYAEAPTTDVWIDVARRQVEALAWVRVVSEQLEVIEHDYPDDWWQAFKERWFPAWLLRRFPVRYYRMRLTAKALYPRVSLPEETYAISLTKWGHTPEDHE